MLGAYRTIQLKITPYKTTYSSELVELNNDLTTAYTKIFCSSSSTVSDKSCYRTTRDDYLNGKVRRVTAEKVNKSIISIKENDEKNRKSINDNAKINQSKKEEEIAKINASSSKKIESILMDAYRSYIVYILMEKFFGGSYRSLFNTTQSTLFIVPVYTRGSSINKERLTNDPKLNVEYDELLFKNQTLQKKNGVRFSYTNGKLTEEPLSEANAIYWFEIMSDDQTETDSMFETRLKDQIKNLQVHLRSEAFKQKELCFLFDTTPTGDQDYVFFTGFYNTPLSVTRGQKVYKALRDDLRRNLSDNRTTFQLDFKTPVNPMINFKEDHLVSLFMQFNSNVRSITDNTLYNEYVAYLRHLVGVLETAQKNASNLELSVLTSAQSNLSSLRIFYRLQNIDNSYDMDHAIFDSQYMYVLQGIPGLVDIPALNDKMAGDGDVYVGWLTKIKDNVVFQMSEKETIKLNQLIKTKYSNNTANFVEALSDPLVDKNIDIFQQSGSSMLSSIYQSIVIELDDDLVHFRASTSSIQTSGIRFPGVVKLYRNMHTNESYRWFKHRDLDKSLPDETKIYYNRQIIFDKECLSAYLVSTNLSTSANLGIEFLKINNDRVRLVQFVRYVQSNYPNKVNYPSVMTMISGGIGQSAFDEKVKQGILDILFQPNNIVHAMIKKTQTLSEQVTYKVVKCHSYPADLRETPQKPALIRGHLNSTLYGTEEEYKYCTGRQVDQCEAVKNEYVANEERALVILEVTQDINKSLEDLQWKASCKHHSADIKSYFTQMTQGVARLNDKMIQTISRPTTANKPVPSKVAKQYNSKKGTTMTNPYVMTSSEKMLTKQLRRQRQAGGRRSRRKGLKRTRRRRLK
jgi:hypothetical protein